MKKILTSTLVLMLIFALSATAYASSTKAGHAVFRDKAGISTLEHAGIVVVDNPESGISNSIVHHPGNFDNVTEVLNKINFATFTAPATYRGAYYIAGVASSTYDNIGALAETLCDDYHIQYTAIRQMTLDVEASAIQSFYSKIQPFHVLQMRCDGLTEYCYEYYDVRLLGSNAYWNIANPAHFDQHDPQLSTQYTPAAQRAIMDPVN